MTLVAGAPPPTYPVAPSPRGDALIRWGAAQGGVPGYDPDAEGSQAGTGGVVFGPRLRRVPGRTPTGMGPTEDTDIDPNQASRGEAGMGTGGIGAGEPPPAPAPAAPAATEEDEEAAWRKRKERRQKLAKYYGPGGPGYVTPAIAEAPANQTGVWKAFWERVNARRAAREPAA